MLDAVDSAGCAKGLSNDTLPAGARIPAPCGRFVVVVPMFINGH